MYTIAVKRDFIARHYLIGGNWGPENIEHAHHYRLEVQIEGSHLNRHGYLVDIVEIEERLVSLIDRYRDKVLNDLPQFEGKNPSIEHFASILSEGFVADMDTNGLHAVTIKIWENEIAWTSYRREC
jgi:6-pyruvoyltetrahydropterin/6-carboxytetrahydropterin synthase